ncbi:MAG: DUF2812 domain-containing protein [Clostridium sp.]|uniref:DUF2812 domain-containing protein n=1 Tax=Clostridium sp. TaxID=1506 RepID=UPI0025C39FC9|nr:DUF2812 domain-containing protein [Clostridium sp.]MCF0148258.1 DUF2812 domain-containing protein [Clostridium sp.]
MIKFRWYYDKDREEEFLNSMVAKGYAMTRFFLGVYHFEKCEPGEYTYRVDIIEDKNTKEKNEFYDLIRETGGELIQTWGVWAFFRKRGDFELYSDNESKIEQYRRIKNVFLTLSIIEGLILAYELYLYNISKYNGRNYLIPLFIILTITFGYQVYKCKEKIKSLRDE